MKYNVNVNQTQEQDIDVKSYNKRICLSRLRILDRHGFYGIMLMHMRFKLDLECDTAYTDGDVIAFSPKFMDDLDNDELDFVMMHEIMHVCLKHCFRGKKYDQFLFNIACDIVVNSNLLKSFDFDLSKITLKQYGESMHIAPNKQEGYLYTAEEVYDMLINKAKSNPNFKLSDFCSKPNEGNQKKQSSISNGKPIKESKSKGENGNFDDHTKWNKEENEETKYREDEIDKAIAQAASSCENSQRGTVPKGVELALDEMKNPGIDWKTLLNDFVQRDSVDYSFNPPDRRFEETGFYIPDFNEPDEKVEHLLFMVDTSGSVDEAQLSQAYAEVIGAMSQFKSLEGYLGFFDAKVYDPLPFSNVSELKSIKPKGGGGTDFHSIYYYINNKWKYEKPALLIILTDGYAPFPSEKEMLNIPTLWLINNDIVKPPHGKVAVFKVE